MTPQFLNSFLIEFMKRDLIMTHGNSPRFLLPWLSLGSFIEYYDFVIYGLMVKELGGIFFPTSSPQAGIIQAFLIFGVGYIARPFGGTLAGILGDKFGRRPVFLWITGCMAATTFAIGILPSYESVGILAPLLLTVCRLIQGLSFGGEIPGATIILGEFHSRRPLGLKLGLLLSSTCLGALVATGVLALLFTYFSPSQITAGAWRLPFLGGAALGGVLLFLRWSLSETPIFTSLQKESRTIWSHMNLFRKSFSKGAPLFLGALFASLIISNLFFPYYISTYFGYSQQIIYTSITTSLLFSMVITPWIGRYADKINKSNFFSKICITYLLVGSASFFLLTFQSIPLLFLFVCLHQTFIACLITSYFPLMVVSFSPKIRYTMMGFSYNGIFALAAFLPSFFTTFLPQTGPILLPVVLSLCSLISWYALRHLPSLSDNSSRLS